jgi:hypothetical protein
MKRACDVPAVLMKTACLFLVMDVGGSSNIQAVACTSFAVENNGAR